MRVPDGVLSGETCKTEEGAHTLTDEAAAGVDDRMRIISWRAPALMLVLLTFGLQATLSTVIRVGPNKWNQLIFALQEGDEKTTAMGTRTLFAGTAMLAHQNQKTGVDLKHMGAEFRAHVLGLLGFGVVLAAVVLFAGLMLRYSFSSSYQGRSNQLRLRYKIRRRGDQ